MKRARTVGICWRLIGPRLTAARFADFSDPFFVLSVNAAVRQSSGAPEGRPPPALPPVLTPYAILRRVVRSKENPFLSTAARRETTMRGLRAPMIVVSSRAFARARCELVGRQVSLL